ncbi:cyclase/dehydrase, partial [Cantharellus anzutake]|uniref:cyclase/dehydrase n=1 Tax=Cantharellus anzutake TaxID=1750568 RepID=UPI0019083A62
ILRYTQKQLYDVVSDVNSYHRFVPYCTGSRVVSKPRQDAKSKHDEPYLMEMTVVFLSVRQTYVSEVWFKPFESVQAVAASGNSVFKSLQSIWTFQPLIPSATSSSTTSKAMTSPPSLVPNESPQTRVSLEVIFHFQNPLHAALSRAFTDQVSHPMIAAFEERCKVIYGTPSSQTLPRST